MATPTRYQEYTDQDGRVILINDEAVHSVAIEVVSTPQKYGLARLYLTGGQTHLVRYEGELQSVFAAPYVTIPSPPPPPAADTNQAAAAPPAKTVAAAPPAKTHR